MCLYKVPVIFLLVLFSFNLSAQQKSFQSQQGKWTATGYDKNVVKLVFTPVQYSRNENITSAVIRKPSSSLLVQVKEEENSIWVGGGKRIAITPFTAKDGYNGFRILLSENEKIFGGGERALPLNRRGYRFPLYNNPWYGYSNGADALNFSVPFFTSSAGYALFFDNASKGYADIGKTDPRVFEAGFTSGELNVYVILGNGYSEILSSYHRLTGNQPLPPRWAMGNFMSRFGYTSEANVTEIAREMDKDSIPYDAVIFDLFWFGDSIKNTLGNLDWVNKSRWPDPAAMISNLSKKGKQTILIAEPFILKGTKNYEASLPYHAKDSVGNPFTLTNFYFGYGGLLDIFRKDAGNWIWNNHYKKQIANGVHAWWTDLGEPEKHPAEIMHDAKDWGVKRLLGADEVHNIYGHYWNKMLSDKYAAEYPAIRLFHLNRSGFAGSQRYSIFPWSGDVSRSWSGLQAQVPLMLGMSMSGIPYIHADAGGFAGGEGDNELYVRWLQYAAFTPVFRPHGTALFGVDPNTFNFPSEPALISEPYRNFARNTVWLRYLMLPYNYTLAYQQTKNAKPLVAPLYYYYPSDSTAVNINDQYFWGENMLVAPVLEKNAAGRRLYLPAGKWYDFFDVSSYNGGKWIEKKLDSNTIPVLVKEGSFIPLSMSKYQGYCVSSEQTFGQFNTPQFIYYPSDKKTTGLWYDDDGISKKGWSEVISFSGQRRGNKLFIEISTNNKSRYSKNYTRQLAIGSILPVNWKHVGKKNGHSIPNEELIYVNCGFNKAANYNFIYIDFKGEPVKLEINLDEN